MRRVASQEPYSKEGAYMRDLSFSFLVNNSLTQTTGLSLSLVRSLHLPNTPANQKNPLHITDTLTSVNFKGPEYVVPSGVEGMASLVFDVPKDARGVRGGLLEGDEESDKQTESIFEIKCSLSIKIGMGIGRFGSLSS